MAREEQKTDNIKAARFHLIDQIFDETANKIDRVIVPTETMKQMLINTVLIKLELQNCIWS